MRFNNAYVLAAPAFSSSFSASPSPLSLSLSLSFPPSRVSLPLGLPLCRFSFASLSARSSRSFDRLFSSQGPSGYGQFEIPVLPRSGSGNVRAFDRSTGGFRGNRLAMDTDVSSPNTIGGSRYERPAQKFRVTRNHGLHARRRTRLLPRGFAVFPIVARDRNATVTRDVYDAETRRFRNPPRRRPRFDRLRREPSAKGEFGSVGGRRARGRGRNGVTVLALYGG